MVDKIVLFILIFLFAALVLSVIGSYILLYMNKADAEYAKKKKEVENKIKCKQVELAYKKRLWNEYFWHKPMRFFWISLAFIGAIIVTTILPIYLNNLYIDIASIILAIIIFGFYIHFLKFAYDRYINFEKIAKEKLETYEKPIRDAIKDAVGFPGDKITHYLLEDEVTSEDLNNIIIFEQVVDVEKINFPPFGGAKIINSRKLEFIVFTNEFVCTFTGASKFNLLKPARKPEKDGCEEKNKGTLGGASHEYYYSTISFGKVEDDTFKLYLKNGDVIELFKIKDKKLSGNITKTIKHKLRITERQQLRKVDEYAKMEYIKKLRELSKDNE